MLIIAIIVGVILGGAWGEGFGAAAGAVLAWLLVRSYRQEKEIAAMQQALKRLLAQGGASTLDQAVGAPEALPHPPDDASVHAPGTAVAPTATVAARKALPAQTTSAPQAGGPPLEALPSGTGSGGPQTSDDPEGSLWESQPPASWAQPAAVARPPAAPAAPSVLVAIKGWLFGGNTIVKAGVGILFIGLAFLAKYASEHVQVPVELRLTGIAAVALVLLGLGWRLRLSRPGYAQVLQGGAVAVLYLTLFVAFRFYGVLAVGPVFAAMVVVAALAAALAVMQDARALAVIGALGGFATPLLVSTGSGNHVALFSYYLVLDLGIAAVAWHKTWRSLNLVGFIGTFVVGTAWGVTRYTDTHYFSSQVFLIVYFLLFNAILLMPARRLQGDTAVSSRRLDGWVNGTLLFGLPAITFALQHGLLRDTEYGTALSALALAAFYVVLASVMRKRPSLAVTFDASLAMATLFLTLVIPFALDARSTAGAWALEGAGLVWLGFRQSRGLPRFFGYVLLLLSGAAMLMAHDHHGVPTAVFNAYLFNALLASAASLAAAYFVWRSKAQRDVPLVAAVNETNAPAATLTNALAGVEALAQPLFIAWASLWAVAATGVQIDTFVTHPHTLAAWLVALSAIAVVFTTLSARLAWPGVAFPTLAHAPVLAVGVLASALELNSPASGGGWWAWPVALATHGLVLWRAALHWPVWAQRAVHTLGALVLAALGALQGRAVTQAWGDTSSAWAWLGWLAVPALLLMLLPRPATARRWPVSAAPAAYQVAAAAVLAVGLLLWTLLANIVSNGAARPLPYLPLLNPLDLGIGVALMAVWLWLRSDAAQSGLQHRPQLAPVVLGVAGFVWLNAMLVRAFHHFGGVPFRMHAWVNSLAVQTGITLLWTATALVLMWGSAHSAKRSPPRAGAMRWLWMVGAGLLGAVVLKLLLVDLSGTGTVMRIVSFIGVGVLMLVIGYVAPLPAKASPEDLAKEQGHATT